MYKHFKTIEDFGDYVGNYIKEGKAAVSIDFAVDFSDLPEKPNFSPAKIKTTYEMMTGFYGIRELNPFDNLEVSFMVGYFGADFAPQVVKVNRTEDSVGSISRHIIDALLWVLESNVDTIDPTYGIVAAFE